METHKLLLEEHPLVLLPGLATHIGLSEAVVLQQLHYWLIHRNEHGRRTAHRRNNRWWVYNRYQQWRRDNFPFFSVMTIRRVFERLEARGVVISHLESRSRQNGKWYTIDYDRFAEVVRDIAVKKEAENDVENDDSDPDEFSPDFSPDFPTEFSPDSPTQFPPANNPSPNRSVTPRSVQSAQTVCSVSTDIQRLPRESRNGEKEAEPPSPGEAGAKAPFAVRGETALILADGVPERLRENYLEDLERAGVERRRAPAECPVKFIRAGMFGLRKRLKAVPKESAQVAALKEMWADEWTLDQIFEVLDWLMSPDRRDGRGREAADSLLTVRSNIGNYFHKKALKETNTDERKNEQHHTRATTDERTLATRDRDGITEKLKAIIRGRRRPALS